MNLQAICEKYSAFRKTLGERFETNGRQLKAFCRAMGPNIDIAEVSPEKMNTFLVGKGPLTTSWYVRHNALLGFYRYAISRGFVATSSLPLAIPKQHSILIFIRLLNCAASWIQLDRAGDVGVTWMRPLCAVLFSSCTARRCERQIFTPKSI
jgi:hypothetical protein